MLALLSFEEIRPLIAPTCLERTAFMQGKSFTPLCFIAICEAVAIVDTNPVLATCD